MLIHYMHNLTNLVQSGKLCQLRVSGSPARRTEGAFMLEIHCHGCGGFIGNPAGTTYRDAPYATPPVVPDRGPARCPTCGEYLEFRTDRNGRMMEQCGCGHTAFVERRTGKREEPTQ